VAIPGVLKLAAFTLPVALSAPVTLPATLKLPPAKIELAWKLQKLPLIQNLH
jgi:hypothetical protein